MRCEGSPNQRGEPHLGCAPHNLARKACLADTGLARDQDEPTHPTGDDLQDWHNARELGVAPDERHVPRHEIALARTPDAICSLPPTLRRAQSTPFEYRK